MNLYEIYISEKNKKISEIKTEIAENIKESFSTSEFAIKEYKENLAKKISEMDRYIDEPEKELNFIGRFISDFFKVEEIDFKFFTEAFIKAKENVIEDYKEDYRFAIINSFLNQDDEQIIRKIAVHEAYLTPHEILFEGFETKESIEKTYEKLFKELDKNFIDSVSKKDFVEIMRFKYIREGKNKNKIHWLKSKVDCIRFGIKFEFSIKQLNNCFYHNNGKFMHKNKPKGNLVKNELYKILKNY